MAKVEGGFIFLARKIQTSEIWRKPPIWLKFFIYILQKVNHSDGGLFEKGENFFNYHDIARECQGKYNSVTKFIKWAKSARLVATRKTTRGIIIKVLNYEDYQDVESYKNRPSGNTSGNLAATQRQDRSHTIIKEFNNERIKNKYMCKSHFKIFWEKYPNKKNKKLAEELFMKLPQDLFEKIIQAIDDQIKDRQHLKEQKEFVPPWKNPENWIENECWNDEPVYKAPKENYLN